MNSPAPLVSRVARQVLRSPLVNRAVRALACARGHRLVLVYHRLGTAAPPGCEVVPCVPVETFEAHLQVLGESVNLVSVDEILLEDAGLTEPRRQPAVALTFDDDLPSHTVDALPVLRRRGVPAAFFLSGRALHGFGPYWFQQLEALLAAHGVARTAGLLGVPASDSAGLALACERNADLRRRVVDLASEIPSPGILERDGIAALAAAGMTVGFHTVDHAVLPDLDDAALEDAVVRGRDRLAAASGAAVRHFAYPHGKADARSAAAVRRAGFDAAFTGRPEPLRTGSDRHRLGRWEPGRLSVDDLLVQLAIRLHRAAPPARHGPR